MERDGAIWKNKTEWTLMSDKPWNPTTFEDPMLSEKFVECYLIPALEANRIKWEKNLLNHYNTHGFKPAGEEGLESEGKRAWNTES